MSNLLAYSLAASDGGGSVQTRPKDDLLSRRYVIRREQHADVAVDILLRAIDDDGVRMDPLPDLFGCFQQIVQVPVGRLARCNFLLAHHDILCALLLNSTQACFALRREISEEQFLPQCSYFHGRNLAT